MYAEGGRSTGGRTPFIKLGLWKVAAFERAVHLQRLLILLVVPRAVVRHDLHRPRRQIREFAERRPVRRARAG